MITLNEQELGTVKTALEIAVEVFRHKASQEALGRANYWRKKAQSGDEIIAKLAVAGIE
jgi:hypothetical protein